MNPYFSLPGLSNSGMGFSDDPTKQFSKAALRRGSLVDCMVTQPHLINSGSLTADGEQYTAQEWETCDTIAKRVWSSDIVQALALSPLVETQKVFQREVTFNGPDVPGLSFSVHGKCMHDWYVDGFASADLKTTVASSPKGVMNSFHRFDYDRAAFWYMEVSEISHMYFVFFCVNKPFTHVVHVEHGDNIWKAGRQKAIKSAYLWHLKQ